MWLNQSETRTALAKFGLTAMQVTRPTRLLSPGERTRAELASFQARGVNLLVLDEPTNHLDLPAIEQLESALKGFVGTLLLVSHDRRLLDAVALAHHCARERARHRATDLINVRLVVCKSAKNVDDNHEIIFGRTAT
jgi:ATPase subunit of ABC transporter with duplicated ATPase domains